MKGTRRKKPFSLRFCFFSPRRRCMRTRVAARVSASDISFPTLPRPRKPT